MTSGRLTTVVLDVGETLVDETRQWHGWARWLGVSDLTLMGVPDLYPDARPCLAALRAAGWRVVVGGQPGAFQHLLENVGLPVDLVTSSAELGAQKPAAEFFRRLAAAAGTEPHQCVHVGDRVDNDVVAARDAGLTVVHLARGPWGLLFPTPPDVPRLDSLQDLPALLETLRGG